MQPIPGVVIALAGYLIILRGQTHQTSSTFEILGRVRITRGPVRS